MKPAFDNFLPDFAERRFLLSSAWGEMRLAGR